MRYLETRNRWSTQAWHDRAVAFFLALPICCLTALGRRLKPRRESTSFTGREENQGVGDWFRDVDSVYDKG